MAIRDWPEHERPREKLLSRGASTLSDAELLALFLGSGRNGHSAVDVGRELLLTQGSLRNLLDLAPATLMGLPGIGPARACALAAALELGIRHLQAGLARGQLITDPAAAGRFLAARLRAEPCEVFACLFLDSAHRAIAYEPLFRGTIDGAQIYPREVLRRCIYHNAAAVVLAHNHPSGSTEPSDTDREVTRALVDALALIDIRVLDHFVVGDGPPLSFAERGLL